MGRGLVLHSSIPMTTELRVNTRAEVAEIGNNHLLMRHIVPITSYSPQKPPVRASRRKCKCGSQKAAWSGVTPRKLIFKF